RHHRLRHRHLLPQRRGLRADGPAEQARGGHRQRPGIQRAERVLGDGLALGHLPAAARGQAHHPECGRHQRGCAVDVWDLGLGDPLCLHATLLQALILLRPYPGER
ncbi:unnamed protein product, partial [Effrenium voratum]